MGVFTGSKSGRGKPVGEERDSNPIVRKIAARGSVKCGHIWRATVPRIAS